MVIVINVPLVQDVALVVLLNIVIVAEFSILGLMIQIVSTVVIAVIAMTVHQMRNAVVEAYLRFVARQVQVTNGLLMVQIVNMVVVMDAVINA